jgi:hypothetical protein
VRFRAASSHALISYQDCLKGLLSTEFDKLLRLSTTPAVNGLFRITIIKVPFYNHPDRLHYQSTELGFAIASLRCPEIRQ